LLQNQHDSFRAAVVNEPRGSDVIVGALLCPPGDPSCTTGVIFFNNVGYIGMCGHGTIGLVVTLAYLDRIKPGEHRIETPVGVVTACLHESGEVSVQNVPSYRHAKAVAVEVEGHGRIVGDVAWGGNWFFLVKEHGQDLSLANVDRLVDFTWRIRQALTRQGITGKDGQEIDHVELFAPSSRSDVRSKNFVLCPGGAYDRSPCGTGTSAKMACLFADGEFQPGQIWRQESIVGSVFEGSIRVVDGVLYPTIKGDAYITAEAMLILDPRDPFRTGIHS
jgi:4-hydroxyproline epimerase